MIGKRKALPSPFEHGAPVSNVALFRWLRAVEAQERDKYARSDIWREGVEELIEVSRRAENRWRPVAEDDALPDPQGVHIPGKWWSLSTEAAETLRKVLCENLVERIVVGRGVWRRLIKEVYSCAGEGFLPLLTTWTTRDDREASHADILDLVQAIAARAPEALVPKLRAFFENGTTWPRSPRSFGTMAFEAVLYDAGCQMRSIGQVHLCFMAFARTTGTWWLAGQFPVMWEPQDAVVPGRLFPSRYGIPDLRWPVLDGEPENMPHWAECLPGVPVHVAIPWGEGQRFDWSPWRHVIGCGTSIDHDVLEAMGIPADKCHVWEVHARPAYLDPAARPLRGRVAVVDDFHEGETSTLLAQVYNADVICLSLSRGVHPSATFRPVAAYPGGWDAICRILGRDPTS